MITVKISLRLPEVKMEMGGSQRSSTLGSSTERGNSALVFWGNGMETDPEYALFIFLKKEKGTADCFLLLTNLTLDLGW